ncbi:MAG: proprotein convertase P-domain-containing protein [Verrucomicrobiales bacterium]|nr:proprotein convertase P-domain-containing protein [Verrucomicrobiales bacterium]
MKHRNSPVAFVTLTAAPLSLVLASLTTAGATFSNGSSISIPDTATASPYPSTLTVSGLGTSLSSITVTLHDFTHSAAPDVGIVLQSPSGANVMLMGQVGGSVFSPVTLTFDDAAASQVPVFFPSLTTGSYKPTDNSSGFTFADGGSHAEPTSWTTTLATFVGTNPNGDWKLFVQDFFGGDTGSIASGWSMNLTAVPEPGTYTAIAAAGLMGFALLRARSRASSKA